jgi:hypothetical protein
VEHRVLTLTGAAQSLLTAFGADEPPGGANDPLCSFLSLQAPTDNSNAVFVGGSGVSATDYGARIPVPVTNIPEVPFVIAGGPNVGVRLSQVFVIGTADEAVHILYDWM